MGRVELSVAILTAILITPSFTFSFSVRESLELPGGKLTERVLKIENGEITIIRDSFGVPRIFAATDHGYPFNENGL